ncbi:hypothetical protein GOBAR_AA38622 [Gossypium barbadense]|uniref:Uncharacterized protein n=1 Tax=Gossypium barbadense TaxID=3634 RepID=A0A2P5VTF1_GOSBA|nr:hypothetical protein GOBAR_AA38622 [Gossypium barbadense]
MVVEAGYRVVKNFVYCKGELNVSKGLSVCCDNSSFIAMINHIRNIEYIHVYVEQEVDTPDIIDDTMLPPAIRDKEVNSGVREPHCNEELNCNERVNSGAREPFTKLGRESNVGLELGESSVAVTLQTCLRR